MQSHRSTIAGRLASITRYPVKSMAGETLERTEVLPTGLHGDRIRAFVDETKTGWDRFVTARDMPALLAYRAVLAEGKNAGLRSEDGDAGPDVRITAPAGRLLDWDEAMRAEAEAAYGKPVALEVCRPDENGLLGVDCAPLLIMTGRTFRQLGRMLGGEVDARRFRPNLVVELADDTVPDETAWIGRRLRIGSCELEVTEPCERCMMITLDPDTQARDPRVLRVVSERMAACAGVYASVVRPGEIRVGDPVELP